MSKQKPILETLGLLRIQVSPGQQNPPPELSQALGLELPTPGHYQHNDSLRIHWLTPNEWLLCVPLSDVDQWRDRLEILPLYVTETSDSRVRLLLTHSDAPEQLAEACALDLHPSVFTVGCSTVTRVAKIAAMVSRLEEGIEVMVDRSMGEYLMGWLPSAD